MIELKDSAGDVVAVCRDYYEPLRVDTDVGGESMTKQSFKDECDINVIMARYERTGQMPLSNVQAMFGDFSSGADLHANLNAVKLAEENFIQNVPADIRSRFSNDVGLFLDFVLDPKNEEEMVKLGLAVKKPAAQAAPAVVPPATPSVPAA